MGMRMGLVSAGLCGGPLGRGLNTASIRHECRTSPKSALDVSLDPSLQEIIDVSLNWNQVDGHGSVQQWC